MRTLAPLLLLLSCGIRVSVGESKRTAPYPKPTIGQSLDLYGKTGAGPDMQIVGVMAPGSGLVRKLDPKTGKFTGPHRRRGIQWWYKKKPRSALDGVLARRRGEPSFTMRMMQLDPRGVAMSMVEEGSLSLHGRVGKEGRARGRQIVSVRVEKPKSWWKRLI